MTDKPVEEKLENIGSLCPNHTAEHMRTGQTARLDSDRCHICYGTKLFQAESTVTHLREQVRVMREKLDAINTPEIQDFILAVEREAKHQRLRWGVEHDGGKTDADWFWLIGYLAGKALHNPGPFVPDGVDLELLPAYKVEKQLHRIVTIAAAALNWHSAKLGTYTAMRPGIEPPIADTKGCG